MLTEDRSSGAFSPRRFGDYELLEEVARGGMGIVYQARHRMLQRVVALKMIPSGELASPEAIKRFYLEAQAAARLDHPAIVPVHEVGEQDGQHYFTMGFVTGGSLAQRLNEGPLIPDEAAQIVGRLAGAMAYAHEQGVIHRDLKPASVLLAVSDRSDAIFLSGNPAGRYEPKISDFGLARHQQNDSQLTGSGQILGTPSYMPPEQAARQVENVGPLSDVYSLGAILYCLLTGHPPFRAATVMETLTQVIEQEPVSPRVINPAVPQDLETICLKCLEKDPRRRYASAQALQSDLDSYLAGIPIQARPVSRWEQLGRWCRRHPLESSLTAVGGLALVLLMVAGYLNMRTTTLEAEANTLEARTTILESRAEAEEARAEVEKSRAEAEKVRADTQAQLAATLKYLALTRKVRENSVLKPVGWTWQAERDLQEAAQQSTPLRETEAELRSLWVSSLSALDLQESDIPPVTGFDVSVMAMRPDGKQLALAEKKAAGGIQVRLYDPQTGQLQETLAVRDGVGGALTRLLEGAGRRFQEGITCLDWSRDGLRLVVGTRHNKVHLWTRRDDAWQLTSWSPWEKDLPLHQVKFSPDATQVYTVARSLDVQPTLVWDADTGKQIQSNEMSMTLGYPVQHFDVDPQDRYLLVMNDYLARPGDLKLIRQLPIVVSRGCLSQDGNCLAVLNPREDGEWCYDVYHLPEGELISRLTEPRMRAGGEGRQVFFADGRYLITSDEDRFLRIWEVASGQMLCRLPVTSLQDEFQALFAVDEQGRRLAVHTSGVTRFYDLHLPQPVQHLTAPTTHPIQSFDYSPLGDRLLALTESWPAGGPGRVLEGALHQFNSRTGTEVGSAGMLTRPEFALLPQFLLSRSNRSAVQFHPDGRHFTAATSLHGFFQGECAETIGQFQPLNLPLAEGVVALEQEQFELSGSAEIVADPLALDGKALRLSPGPDNHCLINVRKHIPAQLPSSVVIVAVVRTEAARPHSGVFAWGYENRPQHDKAAEDFWSFNLESPGYHLLLFEHFTQADRQKLRAKIIIKLGERQPLYLDRLLLISTGSTTARKPRSTPGLLAGPVALSPDGTRVWGVAHDNFLTSWDAASGEIRTRWDQQIEDLTAGIGTLTSLTAGNRVVVTGNVLGKLDLFAAEDSRRLSQQSLPHGTVFSVALTPDEAFLLAGCDDGKAVLVDTSSLTRTATLELHALSIRSLVFSPDARWLITGGQDRSVKIWRWNSGKPVLHVTLEHLPEAVRQIRLSRDQQRLGVLLNGEHAVRLWDFPRLVNPPQPEPVVPLPLGKPAG